MSRKVNLGPAAPALLTRTSIGPNAATVFATISLQTSGSAQSPVALTMKVFSKPSATKSSMKSSSLLLSRPVNMTCAPSRSSCRVIKLPIEPAAPVRMMHLLSRRRPAIDCVSRSWGISLRSFIEVLLPNRFRLWSVFRHALRRRGWPKHDRVRHAT